MTSLIQKAAFEPAITGTLLYVLTKNSGSLRTHLRALLSHPLPLTNNYIQTLITPETVIKTLKWLLALGIGGRVNAALSRWALNNWKFGKQGAAWDFAPGRKTEIAVVTGGCSGIGLMTVKGLAERMRVVVLDIQDAPEEIESHPSITYFKCDVTSASSLTETASLIRSKVGTPTILINNAGIGSFHPILETSEESLEKIFRVNLLSHWTTIKEFLPAMLEGKKGHIIEIASLASYTLLPGISDYGATKAGVLALYEGLRQELKHVHKPNGQSIQLSIIHPSWIQTPLIADYSEMIKTGGLPIHPPKLVADRIVKQVLSGESGHVFVPDGMRFLALFRALPSWVVGLLGGAGQYDVDMAKAKKA